MARTAAVMDLRAKDFHRSKLDWVKAHIPELVARHPDQCVCIVGGEVKAARTCADAHNVAELHDA